MTHEEWWVVYSLRFGPDALRRSDWQEGEGEFMDHVAKQFGFEGAFRRGDVINMFRKIQHKEERRAATRK